MQIFAEKKFENPVQVIEAFDSKSFIEAFSQIEVLRKRSNTYLLGYIRYEAKDVFLGKKIKSKYPLLYFEVFNEISNYKVEDKLLKDGNIKIIPQLSYQEYEKSIKKIKKEIASGNTYEVNYTYEYKIETGLEGFDLYNSILPKQTTSYNAYIKNKYEEILSFSPELFFMLEKNKIKTKPMKGTIERGLTLKEDIKNIEFLKNDTKNRAENVMIVDLLRNDLGKIAKTATVKVEKLFEIETHPTVHQMTSEISAELEDNCTLYEIFNAIYPCGSITGAPKISTMNIIDEVEVGKREIYCGAIGLITPAKTIFSVPIRILQKHNNQKYFSCRVGGAIVWDSTAKDEWKETLTKINFLRINDNPDFELIETILVKNGKPKHKTAHFNRMKKSTEELGFNFNKDLIKINPKEDCILRILLDKNGNLKTQILPLNPIETNKITISKIPVSSKEKFLYHKTTYRPWYEKSKEKIKSGKIFDEIFFNEKGELTEGTRSNIILQINRKWYTPPVKCGLLNGVLRKKLIKEAKLKERNLYFNDLKNAEKIFCINSVRGFVEVELEGSV